MLEILALRGMAKKLSEMAKDRGVTAWPFLVLLFVLWFGGEIGGLVAGIATLEHDGDGLNILVYVFALVGALIGGSIPFIIMAMIPVVQRDPSAEDEFRRPRRGRRPLDDEDDDLDKPRRDGAALDSPRSSLDDRARDDGRFRDRPN
jgi:hypothetical protein